VPPHTPDPPSPHSPPPRPPRALQITLAGFFFLFLNAFVLLAAINSGVNLLYFLFGLFVGAWVVSVLFASVNLRKLSVEREILSHPVAGEPAEVRYRFRNAKPRWPAIGIFFRETSPALLRPPTGYFSHLPSHKAAPENAILLALPITPSHRGILRLESLHLSTTFPFGFLRRNILLPAPHEITVYPRIGLLARRLALPYRQNIESGTLLSRNRGGNEEFFGIREYRPGDNIRAIHWRSTARTGDIMIRETASTAPPQILVVLNLRSWPTTGRPAAERAIELAASVLCWAFYENYAVGLAIAGRPSEPADPPRMGWEARTHLLTRLAQIDLGQIFPAGIHFSARLGGRAQWIVITLQSSDTTSDLVPPPASLARLHDQQDAATATPTRASAAQTILALDTPGSADWVRFLDPKETARLLRDRASS